MKREITVKAFNGRTKQWLYFSIGQQWSDVQQALYSELCLNGVIFYQHTGLKDKNGKEIYEGDITKQGSMIMEVKFRFGCFFFCGKEDNELPQNPFASDFHYIFKQYSDKGIDIEDKFIYMEIIGNIHQDKHLLK